DRRGRASSGTGADPVQRDRRRDAGDVRHPRVARRGGARRVGKGVRMTKVLLVAGARPNYMKIAPIYWAIREHESACLAVDVVHTGQHYDEAMSGRFFRDLDLPEPSVNLAVGLGSQEEQTAKVMSALE